MHFSNARCSCGIEFPYYIFAVNKMKGFDYIQIFYYKWISSYGKTISEYNVKTPNFSCFFIWSIECVEKTDFVQLIISLSNESENPL